MFTHLLTGPLWVAEGAGGGWPANKILSNTEKTILLDEIWGAVPDQASIYIIAREFRPVRSDMTPRTVHAIREHQALKNYNNRAQTKLNEITSTMPSGFAIVRVPALYEPFLWNDDPMYDNPLFSYVPDLVNLLLDGRKVIMPKTFCKVGGRDIFEEYMRHELIGYEPEFIDAGFWHAEGGAVHCSTNAQRKPLDGGRWW